MDKTGKKKIKMFNEFTSKLVDFVSKLKKLKEI